MSNNPTCSRCGLEVSELVDVGDPTLGIMGSHTPDHCIAALKAVITVMNKNWAEAEKIISDIRRLMGTKDDEYSMRGPTTRLSRADRIMLSAGAQPMTAIRPSSNAGFVIERVVNKPKGDNDGG